MGLDRIIQKDLGIFGYDLKLKIDQMNKGSNLEDLYEKKR